MNQIVRLRIRQIIVLSIIMWLMVGCATFKQNTYNILYTSGVAYDTAMSVAGDLYKQGVIKDVQKDDIIKYGNAFYSAYHAAVDAFEVWNKTDSAADKDKMITALNAILPKLMDLKNYLNRLNIDKFDSVLDRLDQLNQLIKGM